jgi:hypothetical protein
VTSGPPTALSRYYLVLVLAFFSGDYDGLHHAVALNRDGQLINRLLFKAPAGLILIGNNFTYE